MSGFEAFDVFINAFSSIGQASAAGQTAPPAQSSPRGQSLDVGDGSGVTPEQADALIAQGWRGNPNDRSDTLYSPDHAMGGGPVIGGPNAAPSIPFGSMDMGHEVNRGSVSQPLWDDLIESGYRGSTPDAIYAPGSEENPDFGPDTGL